MKHIERIDNRDGLSAFHFLLNVSRDEKGRIVNASRVTVHGFNFKSAVKRLNMMTEGAAFVPVPRGA